MTTLITLPLRACHLEAWFLSYNAVSANRSVSTSVRVGDSICAPLPSGELREQAGSKYNFVETVGKEAAVFQHKM